MEFFAKLSNVMAKLKQFSVKLMVSENPVTYVLGRQMVEKKALVIYILHLRIEQFFGSLPVSV